MLNYKKFVRVLVVATPLTVVFVLFQNFSSVSKPITFSGTVRKSIILKEVAALDEGQIVASRVTEATYSGGHWQATSVGLDYVNKAAKEVCRSYNSKLSLQKLTNTAIVPGTVNLNVIGYLKAGYDYDISFDADLTAACVYSPSIKPFHKSNYIAGLYRGLLNREPDLDGFLRWLRVADSGATCRSIALGFGSSEEYRKRKATLTSVQIITEFYLGLLGRKPDAGGLTYWNSVMAKNGFQVVADGFLGSAEFQSRCANFGLKW